MVIANDLICEIYMHIHLSYMSIKYMTCMCSLMGISISGTYMAIACKVHVVVVCVFSHVSTNVGSLWPYEIREV